MTTLSRKLMSSAGLIFALYLPMSAQGKSTEAPNIRAVQTDSTDVFAVLSQLKDAEIALERRDYSTAKQGFEAILMHDPSLKPARIGMRRSLMAMRDMTGAAQWLDDETSLDGLIIRIILGQIDDPETELKAALRTTSDPRLWTLLGTIRDKDGEHSDARQAYAMAGLAGARPGLAQNNIGQSHWLEGQMDLALDAFESALEADSSDVKFDNNRRRALIALGQTHDAVAGLNAERAGVFLAKAGDHAMQDGELKLAKYLYQKSLDLAPRHNPNTAEKFARLN